MRVKLPTKLVSVTTTCVLASSVFALQLPVAAAAEQSEAQTPKPKNIIVMIGDGMGYNHIDATSLYENGTTNHQISVNPATGKIVQVPGQASQIFESWPVQVAMSTFSLNGRKEYDPQKAWSDFKWSYEGATDSAASGTALATGVKTHNGILGIDGDGNKVQNVAERASELGKATGVVTSVQFSHATPAAWGAHSASRNDLHGITEEMLNSSLDVIIGAGHPWYNDNHEKLTTPHYDYLGETQWQALSEGQTSFDFVEDKTDFEAIANNEEVPEKLFGLVQVGATLQQGRSGDFAGALPGEVPFNDVPELATLAKAALNTLSQDEDGLFLMVEGGAIDWTGHANQSTRNIEETQDFNKAIETVVDWVETNSNWDETLVIVAADHETGYLDGKGANPNWVPLTGSKGKLPQISWNSGNHTNQLVGAFANGAGSELFASYATKTDPVRGAYLDNTDVARVAFELWADEPSESGIDISVNINKETIGGGELVLTIPGASQGVTLTDATNRGDRLTFTGNLPQVNVTDTRSVQRVGENGGWSVTGKASDFTYTGNIPEVKNNFSASHLSWKPVLVSGNSGVQLGSETTSAMDGGSGLETPATLVKASGADRLGTTSVQADLALEVPVDIANGAYSSNLTVSVFPLD